MNTNSRKQDARSQTEGSGISNPQGGNEISLVQATAGLHILAPFINKGQMQTLWDLCRKGEEKPYFKQKVTDLAQLIKEMPKTYDQDGLGMEAIAYLHYFTSGFDWYITEKDMAGAGVDQAFGLAIAPERELGYISIAQLVAAGAALDLYWTPKTLAEIGR